MPRSTGSTDASSCREAAHTWVSAAWRASRSSWVWLALDSASRHRCSRLVRGDPGLAAHAALSSRRSLSCVLWLRSPSACDWHASARDSLILSSYNQMNEE